MDLSGILSEYRKKNGISQQVGDVGKTAMPGFSNLTYGDKYNLAPPTDKLHVSFSHQQDERVKDIERDSGIEIINSKCSTNDHHVKSSDKNQSNLSNTVDDGFVDISSPNDSDSTSSVDSKLSHHRVKSTGDMAISRVTENYSNQGSPLVRTPQKNVRICLSKPGTPQKINSGSSSKQGTPQKVSCLKKQVVNSPRKELNLDVTLDKNVCLHKRLNSTGHAGSYTDYDCVETENSLSPSIRHQNRRKQGALLSPENQNFNQLFQNLALRKEMKSRQEFNSKSDIDDMELVPSYFNSRGFQLDYCWFCGRPMNLESPGLSSGEDNLEKLMELERLLAQAQQEKMSLIEDQVRLRESEMQALHEERSKEKHWRGNFRKKQCYERN
ncbi:unnamed protein product [Mytilus coruscus]|uniref:Uncharacterized protein n=1 Tax=Mytilus coruscus TaxID=42192 RepID=A0A6J8DXA3_MYTCO|nr:unnamed protein product [Mytilus coruscus]